MSKIYVAYGHGGKDPGASKGGRLEKDYNLRTGRAVAAYLRYAGHQVVEYRTTDTDYGLTSSGRTNRVAENANKEKADYFIDIHYNAGGGHGVECYYSVVDKGTGKAAADQISTHIAALGFTNRGAKTKPGNGGKDYFGVIRMTNMSANLVECAFIDSDADMNHVDEIGVDAVAKAIAQGICDVLGGSVPGEAAPEPTPEPAAPTERHLKGTIITTAMKFRKEPCGEVIRTLPKGHYFTVLYDENGWFCIDFAGIRGYVAIDDNYVKVEDFNTGEVIKYGTPLSK